MKQITAELNRSVIRDDYRLIIMLYFCRRFNINIAVNEVKNQENCCQGIKQCMPKHLRKKRLNCD